MEIIADANGADEVVMGWLNYLVDELRCPFQAKCIKKINTSPLDLSEYQKFPDYLFAKTTYASWCMTNGDIDAFERIFEGKHNLKLLYPHRDSFHIEEFLIFMDIVCRHACHQSNFDYVRQILKVLKKIPESSCITDLIKHRLFMFENLLFITAIEQSFGRGEEIHVNKNNNASKRKKK